MEFVGFPKMARLRRECIVTEKIDGTNAQVLILPASEIPVPSLGCSVPTGVGPLHMIVGSRTRWITPQNDNQGFARWAYEHRAELATGLGVGRHFGEWWGQGIQRTYGLAVKRFSLFNALRWAAQGTSPRLLPSNNPKATPKYQDVAPECCGVVPVLYQGPFDEFMTPEVDGFEHGLRDVLARLRTQGSVAAPGFMNPEGIVTFHIAGGFGFKTTLEKDQEPKGGWL